MSGEDVTQRYHQRLNELMIPMNRSRNVAPSSVGSICESTTGRNFMYNNGQNSNGTLSASQFYNTTNLDQFHVPVRNPQQIDSASTCTGVSDNSMFKKPLPIKRPNMKNSNHHFKRRFDIMYEALCSIGDKQSLKFTMTAMETIIHSLQNPPYAPLDPVQFTDYVGNLIKQEYYSKKVPKSICGSSVTSEQTIDEFPYSRAVLQDTTHASMVRNQSNMPAQRFNNSTMIRPEIPNPRNSNPDAPSGQLTLDKLIDGTLTTSSLNFFNDSEIARRRDEAAVSQENLVTIVPRRRGNTKPRETPKPKPPPTASRKPVGRQRKLTPANKDSPADLADKNISVLNGTATGISKHGRVLKRPVKYWNSKGEESQELEPLESILNESMTLRNKKIVEKKPVSARGRSKSKSPNLPIIEEKTVVAKLSANGSLKSRTTSGKENVATNNRNTNESSITAEKKNTAAKEKTNKKRDTTIKNKEKVNKPAPKRKSKEKNNSATKKKKCEDSIMTEEEDNIFGDVFYKKPAQGNLKFALSPSTGLLSAKKAAGQAVGKATPPCKAIGDMIANESIVSAMSAAKDAPKQNKAVERLVKRMEKDPLKPKKANGKHQVQKSTVKDSQLKNIMDAAISSHSVANAFSTASLSVFQGEESNDEDMSDLEIDEDDDLM